MLEKKVVRYTRNGIEEDNLATGEKRMLTHSEWSKQKRIHAAGEDIFQPGEDAATGGEKRYSRFTGNPKSGTGSEFHRSIIHDQAIQKETGVNQVHRATEPDSMPRRPGAIPQSDSKFRQSAEAQAATSTQSDSKFRQSAAAQQNTWAKPDAERAEPGPGGTARQGGSVSPVERSKIRSLQQKSKHPILTKDPAKSLRHAIVSFGAAQAGWNEEENPGIDAVHTGIHAAGKAKSAVQWVSRKRASASVGTVGRMPLQAAKKAAAKQAANRAAAVRKKAARKAVEKKVRRKAKKEVAKRLLAASGVLKYVLIGVVAVVGLLLLGQILSSGFTVLLAGAISETQAGPEATAYTQQLDAAFLASVDAQKQIEEQDGFACTVTGADGVNTDAKTLEILATKSMAEPELTDTVKAAMAACHAVLNTYTLSEDPSTMTEVISIHVYTAEEKIDAFGFSDADKATVLELLAQIAAFHTGYLTWPLIGYTTISSDYGTRINPITGQGTEFHPGIDIPAPTGTPVHAAAAGTVTLAGANGDYGICVIIDHGGGLQTVYGHNSALLVTAGQSVSQGQEIAEVGQTGRATGPHCHFEVRLNGQAVSPYSYLSS